MEISTRLKQFLVDNIDLVDNFRFDELYEKFKYETFGASELTKVFLEININPLEYMRTVPAYFFNNLNNEPVTIPSNIVAIGYHAFVFNLAIAELFLPDGLIKIGGGAFCSCQNLTTVSLPDSIEYIGEYAFSGCTGLDEIEYRGTKEQWDKVIRDPSWINHGGIVHCTDGDQIYFN